MQQTDQTLYIHFPFCRSKCAYCDFYSSAGRRDAIPAYIDALVCEWRLRRAELAATPKTIYLGGGTPSMVDIGLLASLFENLSSDIYLPSSKEVTIEANPEDITRETLAAYRSMGVNRVSIGIQSFDRQLLDAVSRRHSPEDAVNALNLLNEEGWNYSADLIYGLPGQTLQMWAADLERLLQWQPPHFSAYLLSYEERTPLYMKLQRGLVSETTEDDAAAMYSLLCRKAAHEGYHHYEISNFAKPGRVACHNSAYWDGTPYLGLGPGAHSLGADGLRRYNAPDLKRYMESIANGKPFYTVDDEDDANRANDIIITALRTATGLDENRLTTQYRKEFARNAAGSLRSGLLIRGDANHLIIPEALWLRADAILRDLIVG